MTQHVLVMATEEQSKQHVQWWNQKLLHYFSGNKGFKNAAGDGGTVWVFRSTKNEAGGRSYSLVMRLNDCSKIESEEVELSQSKKLRYGVQGDPVTSRFYAPGNDAKLLLLSLRLQNSEGIKNRDNIGFQITPYKTLNSGDVKLLEDFQKTIVKHSAFISYHRPDNEIADNVSNALQSKGISVFRDTETLEIASNFREKIFEAIENIKVFFVIIGPNTHISEWVRDEYLFAIENNKKIVPIIAGGDIDKFPDLKKYNGRNYKVEELTGLANEAIIIM